jgi:hypothetical protein
LERRSVSEVPVEEHAPDVDRISPPGVFVSDVFQSVVQAVDAVRQVGLARRQDAAPKSLGHVAHEHHALKKLFRVVWRLT